MSKLHNVANDCSFANKDEIVKSLFLICNTNERVKDQLIENNENYGYSHWHPSTG